MARHNVTFLLGSVIKDFTVVKDASGEYRQGYGFLQTVRGPRKIEDNKHNVKADKPIIMSKEPEIVAKMESLTSGDIVMIKGMLSTRRMNKSSVCPHCGERNLVDGVMVYINPIYIKKVSHIDDPEEQYKYLVENREISNQVYCIGTLVRDPKMIETSNGLTVTQYQIALNRKFRVRTDDPDKRADYPWVKAYGEVAKSDRNRLHINSEVYIDGCLQARKVQRHSICKGCSQNYDWADRAMEIVPFATEYLSDYYSDEEIAKITLERAEQSRKDTLRHAVTEVNYGLIYDIVTDSEKEETFSSEEE